MAKKEVLDLEVKSNIKSVSKDTEKLADNLQDVDKGTKAASGGFKKMGTAVKGLGMAMKAAGIGLIVAGFAALKVAMESNQKVMNTVESIMTTISTVMNKVVNVLTDVVVWVTASSERFNGLSKVLGGMITIALTPFQLAFHGIKLAVQQATLAWEKSALGSGDTKKIGELTLGILETKQAIADVGEGAVDAGKDIFNNFSDAVTEIGDIYTKTAEGIKQINVEAIHEQSKSLVASKNASQLAMSQIAGVIAEKEREAELERQIRDNVNATFDDRIAANDRLLEILKESETEQLKLAALEVEAAEKQLATNKENIEFQVAYQEALNREAEIMATITGQMSEQKTNAEALKNEKIQAQKDVTEATLNGVELELQALENEFKEKIRLAKLAGESTVALEKQFAKQKKAIVQANVNDQIEAFGQLAGALSSLAGENKELAAASAIIDTYVGANKALASAPPPINFVAAGAVIASGLANLQKIYSTDVGSGGGGGGGTVSAQPPAPQMMSGAFELTGGQEPQPIQAFVVSDEITDSQNGLEIIRRRATI